MGRNKPRELSPAIHRARLVSLTIYEVSEEELTLLEQGSPDSLLLNLAIFFLSTFTSFLLALKTTRIPDDRTFNVFVIVTAVAGAAGLVLAVLWWRSRRTTRRVVRTIRARLLPIEGIQEPGADGPDNAESPPKIN
jgi:hypothetical protein